MNHDFIVLMTLKMLSILALMDYYYVFYGHDLIYWIDEIYRHPLEYVCSVVVLVTTISVGLSCIEVTLFATLSRRNTSAFNKSRQEQEQRYRRFVFMRLVQQLENALQLQNRYSEQNKLDLTTRMKDMHIAHEKIDQAVSDFRSAASVLLWPNRTDLIMDACVLYHVDQPQLDELKNQGYSLDQPDKNVIRNEYLKCLLNPPGY